VSDPSGPDLSDAWRVPAESRFEAALQRREASRLKRGGAFVADLADVAPRAVRRAPFDPGRFRFRVVVKDRRTGATAHQEDWKSDADGATKALASIEADLARMTIAEFCTQYSMTPS
jgi:hypothetical protein